MAFERFIPAPSPEKPARDSAYTTQPLAHSNAHRWCGPASLALMFGLTYEEAVRRIKLRRRKKSCYDPDAKVAGMYASEVEEILREWAAERGMQLCFVSPKGLTAKNPTLRRFREQLAEDIWERPMLIEVTRHYVVVEGARLWDNGAPNGVPLSESRYIRRHVVKGWRLEER